MKVFRWFKAAAPADPDAVVVSGPAPDDLDAHIARFETALAQCTKGPERIAELTAWRDYYRALKQAREAQPA